MAVLCADLCSSNTLTSAHTAEQEILNALIDFRRSSSLPAAKTSGTSPAEGERSVDRAWSKAGRRITDLIYSKTIKKRQDVTYNLNSFGLRYGKRNHT
ncbi:kisspeptin 1 prepropeptide [Xyrichtys novacula]|uniref:Kisspeptin 1 prepropeptide n=1 Tax=Xyrichtys novacula TaxID=13765 RepID=A0AAV1EPW0_XYRNO|nr:kisspeptin 1 prepropeptide [Xyrichtys novacula]